MEVGAKGGTEEGAAKGGAEEGGAEDGAKGVTLRDTHIDIPWPSARSGCVLTTPPPFCV